MKKIYSIPFLFLMTITFSSYAAWGPGPASTWVAMDLNSFTISTSSDGLYIILQDVSPGSDGLNQWKISSQNTQVINQVVSLLLAAKSMGKNVDVWSTGVLVDNRADRRQFTNVRMWP